MKQGNAQLKAKTLTTKTQNAIVKQVKQGDVQTNLKAVN